MQGTSYIGDGDCKPKSRQWGNPEMNKSRKFYQPVAGGTKGGESVTGA